MEYARMPEKYVAPRLDYNGNTPEPISKYFKERERIDTILDQRKDVHDEAFEVLETYRRENGINFRNDEQIKGLVDGLVEVYKQKAKEQVGISGEHEDVIMRMYTGQNREFFEKNLETVLKDEQGKMTYKRMVEDFNDDLRSNLADYAAIHIVEDHVDMVFDYLNKDGKLGELINKDILRPIDAVELLHTYYDKRAVNYATLTNGGTKTPHYLANTKDKTTLEERQDNAIRALRGELDRDFEQFIINDEIRGDELWNLIESNALQPEERTEIIGRVHRLKANDQLSHTFHALFNDASSQQKMAEMIQGLQQRQAQPRQQQQVQRTPEEMEKLRDELDQIIGHMQRGEMNEDHFREWAQANQITNEDLEILRPQQPPRQESAPEQEDIMRAFQQQVQRLDSGEITEEDMNLWIDEMGLGQHREEVWQDIQHMRQDLEQRVEE